MLAEPIFQFNEELVKPTIAASGSGSSSNNNNNNHTKSSSCSNSRSCSISKPCGLVSETLGRLSLKRPSKLELKINLNEQQTALSSPLTSQHHQSSPQAFTSSHSSVSHDKINHNFSNNNQNSQNANGNTSVVIGGGKQSLVLKDTSNSTVNSNVIGVGIDISKQEASMTNSAVVQTTAKASTTKKKKRRFAADMQSNRFSDVYSLTGEVLGQGAYGKVWTCKNIYTCQEYAVKIIDKYRHPNRERVFKEIEIYLHCRDCVNILKIIEFFEEEEKFYVVFEKMEGGPLLNHIERRGHLTEREASLIVKDIATALNFLHSKGMAHRDLKPENILCQYSDSVIPVKICDFDLGSSIKINSRSATPVTTPELCTPVSLRQFNKRN